MTSICRDAALGLLLALAAALAVTAASAWLLVMPRSTAN